MATTLLTATAIGAIGLDDRNLLIIIHVHLGNEPCFRPCPQRIVPVKVAAQGRQDRTSWLNLEGGDEGGKKNDRREEEYK